MTAPGHYRVEKDSVLPVAAFVDFSNRKEMQSKYTTTELQTADVYFEFEFLKSGMMKLRKLILI